MNNIRAKDCTECPIESPYLQFHTFTAAKADPTSRPRAEKDKRLLLKAEN